MAVEIIYDQSPWKYGTGPGLNSQPHAVRHTSVARHDTDCATPPGKKTGHEIRLLNNSFILKTNFHKYWMRNDLLKKSVQAFLNQRKKENGCK